MKLCNVPGCKNVHIAKGYCGKHYQQIKKFGKVKRTKFDPNEFIIKDDVCIIKLYDSFGNEKAETIISIQDVAKCKEHKWALGGNGYVFTSPSKKKRLYLHHLIAGKPNKGFDVDHKSQTRLDNTRQNLRICRHSENSTNSKKQRHNTSGHVGVCLDKRKQKWMAYITVNGERITLGYYANKREAAEKYNEAAIKYHGEFAKQNHF